MEQKQLYEMEESFFVEEEHLVVEEPVQNASVVVLEEVETKKVAYALKNIERDCLNIQKYGDLTEYGEGQLDLIKVILAELD